MDPYAPLFYRVGKIALQIQATLESDYVRRPSPLTVIDAQSLYIFIFSSTDLPSRCVQNVGAVWSPVVAEVGHQHHLLHCCYVSVRRQC